MGTSGSVFERKPKQKDGPIARKPSVFSDTTSGDKPWLFKKGEVHNPDGKGAVYKEFLTAARAEALNALKVLVSIMNDEEATNADRATACKEILNRGFGKPTQFIESNSGVQVLIVRPESLTTEEIEARYMRQQPIDITSEKDEDNG